MSDALPAAAPHAARAEAVRLIGAVVEDGRGLSELTPPEALSPAERAFAAGRAAETLRRLGQADAVLKRFLRRAPPAPARDALRLAAVELFALAEAPHAACDGAVAAVKARGAPRLAGLVNAVARRLAAEGAPVWAAQDAARVNMPGWLWGRLSSAWGGGAARGIGAAHLAGAPLDLTPRDPAEAEALARELGAEVLPTGSLRLRRPGQVTLLPGYAQGRWWVQDAAAALPVRLLGEVSGLRVLDLCAAPGGKTLQLAAMGARVTALDVSAPRLARLAENLTRCGLAAEVVAADALDWQAPAPFDAVLLDAPCSASGTGRRHPDMLRRRAGPDLALLTGLQDRLLDRAWGWLRPGGRLVYAVCSVLPDEGEARAAAFLARTPDARPAPAQGLPAELLDAGGALRTRPDLWAERGGLDGFFAAGFDRAG